MSRFFIDRPIFAWVIAIVLMMVGALCILRMPITQYPSIAPPAISISGIYPGASAETVQNTVIQLIEQQLNGLDGLRYIESQSSSNGSISIVATFDQGTDPDIAQVQVQNKLQLANSQLPTEVQSQGLRVAKYQLNFMMVVSLISTDGKLSDADLGNYLVSRLQDPILRTKGVGDYQLLGAQYAMRIWMDPAKLNQYGLTPVDVTTAIEQQNVQVSSGKLGGLPAAKGTELAVTVIGKTRYTTADEFRHILLKVNPGGSQVRLGDVATIGLGMEDYSISAKYDGKPSAGIALRLASGANLLETVKAVRKTVDDLSPYFPSGVQVVYPYDTSPVVSASIEEVVKTLIEAIVLVFLVMYLFLQSFRATLVPTLVVPVVLLGTFAVLSILGYSINTLSMFGMVLAIGLLVDDAIVVVENVERVMAEEGLSPLEATRKSMDEVQGALFGIAMVLAAVFLPMAFMSGSTGIIYRQFSITIVTAMALSVLMAFIFTPALCATLLRASDGSTHAKGGFFGAFNRMFDKATDGYTKSVTRIISKRSQFLIVYLGIVALMCFLFTRVPSSFLPVEDQATMFVQVTLPSNASTERTERVLMQVRDYFDKHEQAAVTSVFSVNGFSFAGQGSNMGLMFIKLKPWGERNAEQSVTALAGRAMGYFASIKDARVLAIVPPAVMELGNSSGFDFYLQDNGGAGHDALMRARNQFLMEASHDPKLSLVRPNGQDDQPQYQLMIDEEHARALGLSLSDVNNTLSAAWGSSYVNQFLDQGRTQKVYIQGRATSRQTTQDFNKWYVRNNANEMVPFSSFSSGKWIYGSPYLERFNGVSAVELMGSPSTGYSDGQAVDEVKRIVAKLPKGYSVQWHGMSYESQASASQTPMLYSISLIVVFLCLAALYESWSVPISVILVVPLGIIGAVAATLSRGLTNDVYFQVGLLTTVGLAAKNAILIVEFAKEFHEREGMSFIDAAIKAAKVRLRPILMTSLAFIFGVFPLCISHGAGSGSQHAIGTAVVGGMVAATFLAIFFVPLFYVVVMSLFERRRSSTGKETARV